ncbi:MAG: hypothetical protein AAGL24_10470 [Pseudomonadota bacterium]
MLTSAQRIELLKIAVDISKTAYAADSQKEKPLDTLVLAVFRKLKSEIESGDGLDDTNMSDVKAAIDVASSLDGIID